MRNSRADGCCSFMCISCVPKRRRGCVVSKGGTWCTPSVQASRKTRRSTFSSQPFLEEHTLRPSTIAITKRESRASNDTQKKTDARTQPVRQRSPAVVDRTLVLWLELLLCFVLLFQRPSGAAPAPPAPPSTPPLPPVAPPTAASTRPSGRRRIKRYGSAVVFVSHALRAVGGAAAGRSHDRRFLPPSTAAAAAARHRGIVHADLRQGGRRRGGFVQTSNVVIGVSSTVPTYHGRLLLRLRWQGWEWLSGPIPGVRL